MTIYDELKARGLIAQVTDEEERGLFTTEAPEFILDATPRRILFM